MSPLRSRLMQCKNKDNSEIRADAFESAAFWEAQFKAAYFATASCLREDSPYVYCSNGVCVFQIYKTDFGFPLEYEFSQPPQRTVEHKAPVLRHYFSSVTKIQKDSENYIGHDTEVVSCVLLAFILCHFRAKYKYHCFVVQTNLPNFLL